MKFGEVKDILNSDGKTIFTIFDKQLHEISERKYGQLNYDNPNVIDVYYDDEDIANVIVDAEYTDLPRCYI